VERLIGSIRRELLDYTFFWTATDLQNKLKDYQCYFNEYRTHSGRDGVTPVESADGKVVNISDYRWKKHCRGLFQLPRCCMNYDFARDRLMLVTTMIVFFWCLGSTIPLRRFIERVVVRIMAMMLWVMRSMII
jgi:hypothetical protein